MANNITSNPWVLDTAGFTYNSGIHVKAINWSDQATVGDHLVIEDQAGNLVADSRCNQANFVQNFGEYRRINGLNLLTLDSGKVTISV